MALIGAKPILEIPSFEGLHPDFSSNDKSLEDSLREDFGEEGVAKLQDYNVQVIAPINMDFRLGYQTYGNLKHMTDRGDVNTIGKVYVIAMKDIEGIAAENAQVRLDRESDGVSCLFLTLDLNPANEERRYLRMLFQYKND